MFTEIEKKTYYNIINVQTYEAASFEANLLVVFLKKLLLKETGKRIQLAVEDLDSKCNEIFLDKYIIKKSDYMKLDERVDLFVQGN